MKSFRELADDLTMLDRAAPTKSRVSVAGSTRRCPDAAGVLAVSHLSHRALEIRHRLANGKRQVLSATSIAAIRSALDSGYVKEIQGSTG